MRSRRAGSVMRAHALALCACCCPTGDALAQCANPMGEAAGFIISFRFWAILPTRIAVEQMPTRILLLTVAAAAVSALPARMLQEGAAPAPPAKHSGKGHPEAKHKGLFAKARDFFTSFDKVRGKQEKKASSGLFGVGGPVSFAVGYERMQTWYCKQPENASKSICAAKSKSAKGPHPLFNKSHPEHDDWVQVRTPRAAAL